MRRRVRVTGMQTARLLAASGQRHIDGALGKLLLPCRLLETNALHLERGLNRGLGLVDSLTGGGAFGGRRAPPNP